MEVQISGTSIPGRSQQPLFCMSLLVQPAKAHSIYLTWLFWLHAYRSDVFALSREWDSEAFITYALAARIRQAVLVSNSQ